jgi:hypothetical protein
VPSRAVSRRFAKALASFAEVADPLSRLAAVRGAREALEGLEHETVAEARAAGATWGEIGSLYGVSKQAAQQRFHLPPDSGSTPAKRGRAARPSG